jgi:dephospho-CoA kinase
MDVRAGTVSRVSAAAFGKSLVGKVKRRKEKVERINNVLSSSVLFYCLMSSTISHNSYSVPRAFRLGITGKIASGKSTFSELARSHGINVIDTDRIAKEVMIADPSVRAEIISILGDDAYHGAELNKKFIAQKIFSDDELRRAVERVVHPAVMEVIERKYAEANPGEIIGVESAILVQTGYDTTFDLMILIDATDENIILRNAQTGTFREDDLRTRLAEQDYSPDIEELCDIVIDNNMSKDIFLASSEKIIGIVKMLSLQPLPDYPLRAEEEQEK